MPRTALDLSVGYDNTSNSILEDLDFEYHKPLYYADETKIENITNDMDSAYLVEMFRDKDLTVTEDKASYYFVYSDDCLATWILLKELYTFHSVEDFSQTIDGTIHGTAVIYAENGTMCIAVPENADTILDELPKYTYRWRFFMKIIQFSDSFIPVMDGVGNVTHKYAKCFAEKGHESYVVAPQTDTGYRGDMPFEIIDYVGVPLARLKSYTVGAPKLDLHCQNRLKMITADIVHVHTPFIAGQAGIAYAQKHNVPIVGMFHSKYYDDFLQVTGMELLADIGVKYVVDFYEKCDEVWTVSESSAETLRSYGYDGKVYVMPNGTDIPSITNAVDVDKMYGLSGEKVLLFVGQINWKKNLRCTLEAASILDSPYKLVLAGQGPHEKEVRKLADELGISEQVVFTGHISDTNVLNSLYKRADVFIFPSLYDTSGLVVREAAAMGTPSVVVRGSSAAECINDGENGFLCENDPRSLSAVIKKILQSDEHSIAVIGENAMSQIPIPWSVITDRVIERYKQLCGG